MKIKILFFIIIAIVQILFLMHFLSCKNLQSNFSLVPSAIDLRLTGDIHNDLGMPLLTTRMFHNKFEAYANAAFDTYIYYFSLPFLLDVFSFIGLFGIFCGVYYVIAGKKDLWLRSLFLFVLIVPVVEIITFSKPPFFVHALLFWLVFQAFAMYSWFVFFSHKKLRYRVMIFLVLFIASLAWYFIFPQAIGVYCVD